MNLNKNKKAFTLIEIMVGIMIISMVLIGGFQALISVTIGKSKLIQETDIQKESFYFTEKFFEMIKKGGSIDYEEYFNRKVIGDNLTSSGHFSVASGFGNYGSGGVLGTSNYGDNFYYCRSGVGNNMSLVSVNPTFGCYNNSFNNYGNNVLGKHQRYGEYSFQFIDYNSNYDSDDSLPGDEDADGFIIGDDDDEYLGVGPIVFTGGVDLKELYLISGNKEERIFFRWNVKRDKNAPTTATCDTLNTVTGTGCLGTVEYIKLSGKDWGMNHDLNNADSTQSDGVIDTWMINKDFTGGKDIIAGSGTLNWVSLFPDNINISEFKIYAYPNNDINYNWKNYDITSSISPYIIIKMKMKPSWLSRRKIKGQGKELDFSMTINLTDIYSN